MGRLFCNACNSEFADEAAQKNHYRSDWHQYNLRRKVAGVPGITEALFNLRMETLATEKKKSEPKEPLIYKCSSCRKEYRSNKAYSQHLNSKLHLQKVSGHPVNDTNVIRPALSRNTQSFRKEERDELLEDGSSDEWEEIDEIVMVSDSNVGEDDDEEMLGEWDPCQCFICDVIADGTVEGCVEHMHKQHGFFIPDSEYLTDPRGLLNYLGLKVTKGFMCLYCDESGKRFQSLEAVRKHMISKSHCKIPYGLQGVDDEIEDFYDFSSSYTMEEASTEIVSVDALMTSPVSVSSATSELVLRHDSENKRCIKILGSREFARYYKQRPRPTDGRDSVLVNALVARYRSMGLATRQTPQTITSFKETKKLHHFRSEAMRTKLGMKNNVIRNLPKNVPY